MLAIFVFTPSQKGIPFPYTFKPEFRHCHMYTFNGHKWIRFDFGKHGIKYQVMNQPGNKLLKLVKRSPKITKSLIVSVDNPIVRRWKPLMVQSCNEICRYIAGVDVGFTFNPWHLYNKLLRYDNIRNFRIIG